MKYTTREEKGIIAHSNSRYLEFETCEQANQAFDTLVELQSTPRRPSPRAAAKTVTCPACTNGRIAPTYQNPDGICWKCNGTGQVNPPSRG